MNSFELNRVISASPAPRSFDKGKSYEYRGQRVTFVRSFSGRGVVRRLIYDNRAAVDIGPDEISRVREWSDVPNDGFDWRSLVGAERF